MPHGSQLIHSISCPTPHPPSSQQRTPLGWNQRFFQQARGTPLFSSDSEKMEQVRENDARKEAAAVWESAWSLLRWRCFLVSCTRLKTKPQKKKRIFSHESLMVRSISGPKVWELHWGLWGKGQRGQCAAGFGSVVKTQHWMNWDYPLSFTL